MQNDVSLTSFPPSTSLDLAERHLRDHLSHMVKDFEKHTKTRVPKRGAPNAEYADFVARVSRGSDDANAEGSAEDTTKALVAVSPPPSANANANEAKKMRLSKDPSDPPDAGALLAAWSSYPGVSFASTDEGEIALPGSPKSAKRRGRVAIAMHGHVSNALEIRELYGLPPRAASPPPTPETPPALAQKRCTRAGARAQAKRAEDQKAMPPPPPVFKSPDVESASLLLELYLRRFEDADGDPSDQPATALAACEGSFSFVLLDSTRDAVLAARSAHSDTHPLFWGTAPRNPGETDRASNLETPTESEWDGSTLFASHPAAIDSSCGGAAAAFPLGAFYYVDETMEYGVIQRLNPEGSRSRRKVKPVHRINSSGKVCGLGFYTESGNDLASMAGKYIA